MHLSYSWIVIDLNEKCLIDFVVVGWMEDPPSLEPYQGLILPLASSCEKDARMFWVPAWLAPSHTEVFDYKDSHSLPSNSPVIWEITLKTTLK